MNRVVVTGMGMICPIGKSVDESWTNLKAGKSGLTKVEHILVPDQASQVVGMVQDYHPESLLVDNHYHGADRALLFAKHSVKEALSQANLDLNEVALQGGRVSLALSSAVAALTSMERQFFHTLQSTPSLHNHIWDNPFDYSHIINYLSKEFAINQRRVLIPTGCAGCLDAIGYSMNLIQEGLTDIVITGATEAPITPLVLSAFSKIGAMCASYNESPMEASRPFDKHRDGFVLAEGAGILILENYDSAVKRGAPILAELSGYASVNNGYHMTNIPEDGESIARSCAEAMNDAKINPEEIDHINAHGSSTKQNDIAETNAFRTIFPKQFAELPVTSNKSMVGHALAASNAIETVFSIKTLQEQLVPATLNLMEQDPLCDCRVVKELESVKVNTILKTSSGFSGIHSALVINNV